MPGGDLKGSVDVVDGEGDAVHPDDVRMTGITSHHQHCAVNAAGQQLRQVWQSYLAEGFMALLN